MSGLTTGGSTAGTPTTPTAGAAGSAAPLAVRSKSRAALRTVIRAGFFLFAALALGGASGVVWNAVVRLPTYRVNSDGGASTTERGLTEFFGGDAWFCAIGLVVGLLLGIAGWRLFRDIGWPLVVLVLVAAVGSSLLCWLVGYRLGPGDFTHRLAAAQPGDIVPIELTLRTRAALLAWPFCAVIPVLLGSSLGRDPEEPKPLRRRRTDASAVGHPED